MSFLRREHDQVNVEVPLQSPVPISGLLPLLQVFALSVLEWTKLHWSLSELRCEGNSSVSRIVDLENFEALRLVQPAIDAERSGEPWDRHIRARPWAQIRASFESNNFEMKGRAIRYARAYA